MIICKDEYWSHLKNKLKQSFPEHYEAIHSSIYSTCYYPFALLSLILYIADKLLTIVLFPFTITLHITWNYPHMTICAFLILSVLYFRVFRVVLRRLYQIDLVDYFLYSFIPYVAAIAYTILDVFFPIINVVSLVVKTLLYPVTYLLGHVEPYAPRAGSIRQTVEVWTEYRESRKGRNRKQPAIKQEEVLSHTFSQVQAAPNVPESRAFSMLRVTYSAFRMICRSIYFIFSLIFPFLKKLRNALSIIFHPIDTVRFYIETIHLRAEGVRKTMQVWTPERSKNKKKTELQILNEERNDAREECCACQYNQKNVILQPCGHVCICQKCAEVLVTLKEPFCPICRANVNSITL